MRISLYLLTAAFIGIGCGSSPIPTAIVEGTTGTITLPAEANVGYGRAWSGVAITDQADSLLPASAPALTVNGYGREDLQRGEMILFLVDEFGDDVTRLPVRFISRVDAHSATNSAMDTADPVRKSQVVVVFDVPPHLVSDAEGTKDFGIRVQRYRRSASSGWVFQPISALDIENVTSPQIGWGLVDGGSLTQLIPITIVDHPASETEGAEPTAGEDFTPRAGWDIVIGCHLGFYCSAKPTKTPYFELLAPDYIPHPEFSILTLSTTDHPAAWEFDVEYPSQRMEILGVTLERKMAGQAYLDWKRIS